MQHGAVRANVAYRWPRTLLLPRRPPKVIYLDVNHWIALAKAHCGHPGGEPVRAILGELLGAAQSGAIVVPVSDSTFMEISKIGSHRHRRDLRTVIEAVSGYRVVSSRLVIATHEIEALLDDTVGASSRPINSTEYLDWGVARAFGVMGGFRIRDATGSDVTDEVRSRHPDGSAAFDKIVASAELDLQRSTLDGPSPCEASKLGRNGRDVDTSRRIAERRADAERAQAARLDSYPRWRRGRLRDVIGAQILLNEVNDLISDGLSDRGTTSDDVFGPPERTRQMLDSLPSIDVAMTLKTAYHRDSSHRWTANDIHDIDALGSTVPYCDVVVTDQAMADQVRRTGLAERLDCIVLSKLLDLMDHLS